MVVKANQSISNLQSDLQSLQVGAKTHSRLQHQGHSFQSNNSNLQSALDAEKRVVVKANQSVSNLNSIVKTMQEDAEALTVNYNTRVTHLQLEKSELQSALDAEKGAVVKANQSISNLQSDLQMAQVGAITQT